MRIAYDAKRAYHNSSGLGNYSRDLIRGMVQHHPENEYLLLNPKKSDRLKELDSLENVQEIRPKSWFWKKFSSLWRRFKLVKLAEKEKTEIFHGLSNELPSGIQYAKLKKVVTIHDLIFLRYPNWYPFIDKAIYYSKFKAAAQYADRVIAISEQTKIDLILFFGISQDKIDVVYQTCHPAFKQDYAMAEKERIRTKYSLPSKFVLQVGTIEPRKNLIYTLSSIKDLPDVQLVVIGRQTDYQKEVDSFIQAHNLADRVHFISVGPMEDLAVIYQLAHVFCYPSIFEGFGIPIIEALYSKVPVITNKEGVFPEAAGPDSYYVDLAHSDEMKLLIQTLYEKEDLRKIGIDKSRTFVSKFDEAKIMADLDTVYKSLWKR